MLRNIILVLAIVGASCQGYGQQRPQVTPPPMVQSYEQQRPMVTPPPMVQTFEQQRPQATPAPMVQTYEQQRPMVTPPPMVQTYEQQRPQATPAPMVQTYEQQRPQATPAPMKSYGSYGQQRPMGASEFNPCTEEVMRAAEIQLFPNLNDEAAYLICTDVNTPISMPCSPGTFFDQNLRHCIPVGWEAPRCPVGTCFNNADCVIDELNQASCICRVGFTGDRCEVNIDECALGGNSRCAESSGVCVDQINAFYCEWNNGADIGLSSDKRISRPCGLTDLEAGKQFFALESPLANVFLQCTGEWTFIVTKCADMLFWHQELRTCSIERPLEKTGVCKTYPCRNDGTCVDLGGNSFRCDCKEGYEGTMCEEEIDFCLNKPCQMGGRCVSHPGGFNCVCQDLIVDQSCATGVQNPCNGGSDYLPNSVDATKYITCSLGYGFVKSCAPGLKWNQETYNCMLIEELFAPTHAPKTSSYGASSYGSYGQQQVIVPTITQPPMTQSYGQQTPPTMTTPEMIRQSYGQQTQQTPRITPPPMTTPEMIRQSYGQQTEQTPRFTPPPMTTPEMIRQSYGQQTQQTPRITPPPMTTTPMTHQSYGQQRPQAPVFTQQPMTRPSYGQQQRPQMTEAPHKPSYGQNFGSRMLSFIKN